METAIILHISENWERLKTRFQYNIFQQHLFEMSTSQICIRFAYESDR